MEDPPGRPADARPEGPGDLARRRPARTPAASGAASGRCRRGGATGTWRRRRRSARGAPALARPIRNRSSVPAGGSAPRKRCAIDRTTHVEVRAPPARSGWRSRPSRARAVAPDELGDVAHPAQPQGRPAPVDRQVDERVVPGQQPGRPAEQRALDRACPQPVGIGRKKRSAHRSRWSSRRTASLPDRRRTRAGHGTRGRAR